MSIFLTFNKPFGTSSMFSFFFLYFLKFTSLFFFILFWSFLFHPIFRVTQSISRPMSFDMITTRLIKILLYWHKMDRNMFNLDPNMFTSCRVWLILSLHVKNYHLITRWTGKILSFLISKMDGGYNPHGYPG